MKKLFAIVAMVALAVTAPDKKADAQASVKPTYTITTPDTSVFVNVPSKIKGFQYTCTKSTGTLAGKVYFEGTINGTYVLLDSITLADNTTAQTKVFSLTSTIYKNFRFRNTNTSNATATVSVGYMRRADE